MSQVGRKRAKPVVFISHIHEEAALAKLLTDTIEKAFLGMFEVYCSSEKRYRKEPFWFDRVRKHLLDASIVLVLCSQRSINRPWINFEAGAAFGRKDGARVMPLLHSGLRVDDIKPPLAYCDVFYLSDHEHLKLIITHLAKVFDGDEPSLDIADLSNSIAAVEEQMRGMAAATRNLDPGLHSSPREPDLFEYSSLVRHIVCFHQGEYVQFQFLSSELHKKLRISRNTEALDALAGFMSEQIFAVVRKTFTKLLEHYDGRHRIAPRICLKVNRLQEGEPYVATFVRDENVPYDSDMLLDKNSAFLAIARYGKWVLIDNIPSDTANGAYINSRLDVAKVNAYLKDGPANRRSDEFPDREWVNCWKTNIPNHQTNPPDARAYYKTTLVIPITLVGNELEPTFLEQINKKLRKRIDPKGDIQRMVLGYLCFDHVTTGYFNRTTDVDIGYMAADLISLYLLAKMTYTETSDTFSKFKTNLRKNGMRS